MRGWGYSAQEVSGTTKTLIDTCLEFTFDIIDMIEQYKPQKNTEDVRNIFILKSVSLFNEILSPIIGKYLMTE